MSYESELIKKIEAGTNAVKGKRKTPKDANLGPMFTKLKPLNPGMYEDLMKEYKLAIDIYNA